MAVRIAGLVAVLYGLERILYAVLASMGMFENRTVNYFAVFGVCEVVAGLFLMRGGGLLVELAFPSEVGALEESGSEDSTNKR